MSATWIIVAMYSRRNASVVNRNVPVASHGHEAVRRHDNVMFMQLNSHITWVAIIELRKKNTSSRWRIISDRPGFARADIDTAMRQCRRTRPVAARSFRSVRRDASSSCSARLCWGGATLTGAVRRFQQSYFACASYVTRQRQTRWTCRSVTCHASTRSILVQRTRTVRQWFW